jgi:hypothetical protein
VQKVKEKLTELHQEDLKGADCKNKITMLIDAIGQWCQEHSFDANQFVFRTLKKFNDLEIIKQNLEMIHAGLSNPFISDEIKLTILSNLTKNNLNGICAGGIITHLNNAALQLSNNLVANVTRNTLQQIAEEIVRENQIHQIWQIHVVNYLVNSVSKQYNVPLVEERYADLANIPFYITDPKPDFVNRLKKIDFLDRLIKNLSIEILPYFPSHYGSEFTEAAENLLNLIGVDDTFDFHSFYDAQKLYSLKEDFNSKLTQTIKRRLFLGNNDFLMRGRYSIIRAITLTRVRSFH